MAKSEAETEVNHVDLMYFERNLLQSTNTFVNLPHRELDLQEIWGVDS